MVDNRNPDNQRFDTGETSEIRQKLINRFVENDKNRFDEIMDGIDKGDIKLAHRLAHTLKGAAGQLGLIALQKASETVEHHLEHDKNLVTPEQMETLKSELDAAIRELSPLYHKPAPAAAQPLSREAALELLNKIEPLLEDYDTECMEYIDGLRSIQGAEELIVQIEDFAFETAYETVLKLKSQI